MLWCDFGVNGQYEVQGCLRDLALAALRAAYPGPREGSERGLELYGTARNLCDGQVLPNYERCLNDIADWRRARTP